MFGDVKEAEAGGPFEEAVKAAFPDDTWDSDRIAALKEAIRICSEGDYEDEAAEPEPDSKRVKGPDLALIFGGSKKAKK